MTKPSLWRAYSYAWITLGLFAFSIIGHWIFGWYAFVDEQHEPAGRGGGEHGGHRAAVQPRSHSRARSRLRRARGVRPSAKPNS